MSELKLNLKALHITQAPESDTDTSIEKSAEAVHKTTDTSNTQIGTNTKKPVTLKVLQSLNKEPKQAKEITENKTEEAKTVLDKGAEGAEGEKKDAIPRKPGIHSFSLPRSQKSIDREKQDTLDDIQEQKDIETQRLEELNKPQKEKITFLNYESSFSKQSNHIIKKLRNFQYTPQTRIGFLIGIIGITFGIIGVLMVFFPERHSMSNYKASIISIYSSEAQNTQESPDNSTPVNAQELLIKPKEEPERETEEKPIEDTPENETQNTSQNQKERLRKHLLEKYGK